MADFLYEHLQPVALKLYKLSALHFAIYNSLVGSDLDIKHPQTPCPQCTYWFVSAAAIC